MSLPVQNKAGRRIVSDNIWITTIPNSTTADRTVSPFKYAVLANEPAVGQAMFEELVAYSQDKADDIVIVLLGGRGAQAMYGIIHEKSKTDEIDELLARLHVFTQDALAPMRMNNGLSFVRDFERLLGPKFFSKIKSFTPFQTETDNVEAEISNYLEKLEALGGIDIFFLGLGPETNAASHVCYIKPNSGASVDDVAGIIPISPTILEHHISKFKAGGSTVSEEDETECRRAKFILTLGPAAILGAKRVVQSIVDASTAPTKKSSFKRLAETELSSDAVELAAQADENPGLWVRMHSDVRCYVLPDLIEQ